MRTPCRTPGTSPPFWAGTRRPGAYYQQYLMLNPANAGVRMRVAYELAQAGDPLGAMQFIEVGLEVDPENVDLLKQHGGFAFTAGAELNQGQEEMPPEAVDLFRKALVSYEKVYADPGCRDGRGPPSEHGGRPHQPG